MWYSTQDEQWLSTQSEQWTSLEDAGVTISAFEVSAECSADISTSPVIQPFTAFSNCSAVITVTSQRVYPANTIILYDALLSDLEISLKNFTASRSSDSGGVSRLDVTTYQYDLLSDINDRSEYPLILRKHLQVDGVIIDTFEIMAVDDIVINNTVAAASKTISISGTRDEEFVSQGVDVNESPNYSQLQYGKVNASYYTIYPELRPGDNLLIDGESITIGRISMSFSFSQDGRSVNEQMDVTEAAVILNTGPDAFVEITDTDGNLVDVNSSLVDGNNNLIPNAPYVGPELTHEVAVS